MELISSGGEVGESEKSDRFESDEGEKILRGGDAADEIIGGGDGDVISYHNQRT